MDYSASQIESIVRQVLEGMNGGSAKHECKCGGNCKCGGHGHAQSHSVCAHIPADTSAPCPTSRFFGFIALSFLAEIG